MLSKILGWQTESIMVCYGIFCSRPNRSLYNCVLSAVAFVSQMQMVMFTGLLTWEYHDFHLKSGRVCNKTRSQPASLLFKGQGTEQTAVKWSTDCSKRESLNLIATRLNRRELTKQDPRLRAPPCIFNNVIAFTSPYFDADWKCAYSVEGTILKNNRFNKQNNSFARGYDVKMPNLWRT